MPPKAKYATRGVTESYLIGQPTDSLECGGKLPLGRNVLQYLKHLQSLPGNQYAKKDSIICCPLLPKSKSACCKTERG